MQDWNVFGKQESGPVFGEVDKVKPRKRNSKKSWKVANNMKYVREFEVFTRILSNLKF